MATLITAVELTEQAAMERLFSAAGVTAFSDHEQIGETDTDVVQDAIYDASEEILGAIVNRYEPEQVARRRVVRIWAPFLACYYLCLRRGNDYPASWSTEIERIRAELELIRHGKGLRGIPLRADLRPTWSNLQIDRRWPRSKVRVVRQTGPNVTSTQRVKPADEVVIYDG
jgi:phage gp36-like protein